MKIRIATRRSQLALTQTRWVAAALRQVRADLEIEEIHVVTEGDRVTDKPLYQIGGKGLFVSEVEAYVARGEADLAVHSLKDVPGDVDPAPGLDLVCFPKREDPHDVLITREGEELMDLTAGGRVGTTSLRRVTQLRAHRPDLAYDTLRGNVETRLRRLDEGDFDAIILAAAGLRRLGLLEGRKHVMLGPELCLPAVGQGTLALEARVDHTELLELLAPLEDASTRLVTEAERAFLKTLEGNCRVPIAGHARLEAGDQLSLVGLVGDGEGERCLRASSDVWLKGRTREARIEEARGLGREVAEQLVTRGARDLMREAEAATRRETFRREKTQN
ncbi:MAG: hydroxymethylbilane synthase [Sandaracinus sp.]|nr:hydroxymethylbilane synthase [Sandaracinus sp.]